MPEVAQEAEDDREDGAGGALPGLAEGEAVTVTAARAVRHVTGPPSTWAAIVAVLQQRDYAILHDRRFVPTERGRIATAFLEEFFGRWVEYGFTAAMEADLDRVAGGALAWRGMLAGFWDGFHAAPEDAGGLERATVLAAVEARLDGFLFGAAPVSPDPVSPDRRRCPVCGSGELELRLGRYGPFVGCGAYPTSSSGRRWGMQISTATVIWCSPMGGHSDRSISTGVSSMDADRGTMLKKRPGCL